MGVALQKTYLFLCDVFLAEVAGTRGFPEDVESWLHRGGLPCGTDSLRDQR